MSSARNSLAQGPEFISFRDNSFSSAVFPEIIGSEQEKRHSFGSVSDERNVTNGDIRSVCGDTVI